MTIDKKIEKKLVQNLKGFTVDDAKKTVAIIIGPRGFIKYRMDENVPVKDQLLLSLPPIGETVMGSIDSVGSSFSGRKIVFGIDCQLTDSVRQAVLDIAWGTHGRVSMFPAHNDLLPNRDRLKFYIADNKGVVLKELPSYMQNVRPDSLSESIFYTKGANLEVISIVDAVNENFSASKIVSDMGELVSFLDRVQEDGEGTKILVTTKKNEGTWVNLPNIGKLLKGDLGLKTTTSPADIPEMLKGKANALVAMGEKGFAGILPNAIGFASTQVA